MDGNIQTPGIKEGANLEEDGVRKQALSQIGKLMRRCFENSDNDELALDGLVVVRESYKDPQYRDRHKYMVYRLGDDPPNVPF